MAQNDTPRPVDLLHQAARNTFVAGKFIYLKEVRDATGFDAVRTADAIAIGMYRSVGRVIHGFEMKVSRTDWLKELKQPEKSESLLRFCDTWSLIASTESIVHDGELPPMWGFGIPVQKRSNALPRIHWVVKPPALKPMPYDMVFLTALLAAAQAQPLIEARAALEDARKEGYDSASLFNRSTATKADKLQKIIDDFSQASGVNISEYTKDEKVGQLANEYKAFRETERDIASAQSQLQYLYEQAARIEKGMRKVLKIEENDGTAT